MAKKRLYLIKKTDGRQYWTEAYEKRDGFLLFRVNRKTGGSFGVDLNMLALTEIQEREVDEKEPVADPGL